MAEGVKVISMTSEKLPFRSAEMNYQFIRILGSFKSRCSTFMTYVEGEFLKN